MKDLGFAKFALIGVLLMGAVVGVGLILNRGSHVSLEGSILKVRTIKTDDNSSIALVDFRFKNPANVPFVVKELRISAELPDGTVAESDPIAQMDLDRVLDYHKFVGPRYNPMLLARDRIGSQVSLDRTAASGFAISEAQLEKRKRLVLRILDVDGGEAVISETLR